MTRRRGAFILVVMLSCAVRVQAQSGKEFSIPLEDLKTWAENPIATLQVKIDGHSGVHVVNSDCEMHFGGKVATYKGDPDGWVLEPMNACEEALPGTGTYSKSIWLRFADSVTNSTVMATGLVRIWPEHLTSTGASNPAHAVELHPLLKISNGSKVYDFSRLVYAPEGFSGGLKPDTARGILTGTTVTVTESSGTVEINFESGRIGNFTTLTVHVLGDTIQRVNGSHKMDGQVILDQNHAVPVRLVTVAGSEINNTIAQIKQKRKKTATYDFLVLFSLDPTALYNAAKDSHGQAIEAHNPLQLIIYGEADSE